jgi:hypothetical protein
MTDPIRSTISCERFNDALADFLERDLPESARAEMESHALTCEACGPLLADLRKLRIDAANLEELTPSRDLWSDIAVRIEAPVVSIGTSVSDRNHVAARRRRSMWIGLAAAGLVAVTATATYQITRQSLARPTIVATTTEIAATPTPAAAPSSAEMAVDKSEPTSAGSAASAAGRQPATGPASGGTSPAVATVALASNPTGKLSAAATYDMEISRLRQVVDKRRNTLDSATIAVLEKNLHIIDEAIAQCRQALRQDPSSAYLNESLTSALDDKVQLLRTAASLPVRM